MSTHKVEVVRIPPIEKHPMADTLGLVKLDGYTCIVKLGDFQEGDLAIYIEPDYVVPDAPGFAFLGEHRRIKARRFRGIYSQGLLMKALPGMNAGDDVMELLQITRWDPFADLPADDEVPHESLRGVNSYDVENWRSGSRPPADAPAAPRRAWRDLFVPGEPVIVTEKLHGENARFAWRDGRLWVGSRTRWKDPSGNHSWGRAARDNPWIESLCKALPRCVLFGEVYGHVRGFSYDVPKGKIGFRMFDILELGEWVNAETVFDAEGEELGRVAPIVYEGPYDHAKMEELSLGDSKIGKHMMEGVVIKPITERVDPEIGRVVLKLVSNRYLEKA